MNEGSGIAPHDITLRYITLHYLRVVRGGDKVMGEGSGHVLVHVAVRRLEQVLSFGRHEVGKTFTHTDTRINTHVYVHTYKHTQTDGSARAHIHTHINTHIETHIY